MPGFGKLVKQKRKARTGFNPKTQQKIKIPAKTVVKISCCQGRKERDFGGKEVVKEYLTSAHGAYVARPILPVADAAALTTTLRGSRRGSQMATRTLNRPG